MKISTVILAGGKGRRFGGEKITQVINGETLLERVVRVVSSISEQLILSLAPGQTAPELNQAAKTLEVVDLYPDKGALGGIYTGILCSKFSHNLVVAADMPLLNLSLLEYMIDICPDYDVTVPRIGGYAEPLHAVYSKNCLGPIQAAFCKGEFQIIAFFNSVNVRWIQEDEIDCFDPDHLSFFNVNTQNDLKLARLAMECSSEVAQDRSDRKGKNCP